MSIENERIATHRQEAFELRASAQDQLRRIDQILTVGAAFVATLAGVAVKHREFVLGLPAAVFFLIALVTQIYTDIVTTGSARAAAEHALDCELGPLSTFYGKLAEPFRAKKYLSSVVAVGIAGMLLVTAATIGGGLVASRIHLRHDLTGGHSVLLAYIVATAMFGIAALLAFVDLARAQRDTRDEKQRIIERLDSSTNAVPTEPTAG